VLICAGLVQADELKLESQDSRISYVVGTQIAQQLQMEKVPVDKEALFAGISDFLDGKKPRLTHDESQAVVDKYRQKLQDDEQRVKENNRIQSEAFLKANRSKSGVKATRSGLQYKVLKAGHGLKPSENDRVKVHYQGSLVDGRVFDSSLLRGEPAVFGVNQVVKGWQEALQMMPVGAKWQLFIPAELAYGEAGSGNLIGPNAALIFEVELLEILPLEPTTSDVKQPLH
jgi:FKBP-type peptidyl-prolyl cis-trans isomerase